MNRASTQEYEYRTNEHVYAYLLTLVAVSLLTFLMGVTVGAIVF